MAKMARIIAERSKGSRHLDQIMRCLTVGGVIASGAVLWGYAVFHVAVRTM